MKKTITTILLVACSFFLAVANSFAETSVIFSDSENYPEKVEKAIIAFGDVISGDMPDDVKSVLELNFTIKEEDGSKTTYDVEVTKIPVVKKMVTVRQYTSWYGEPINIEIFGDEIGFISTDNHFVVVRIKGATNVRRLQEE